MRRIFSGQLLESFNYQTRSVRLGGHATSIKLEGAFWEILDEISEVTNKPLGRFLTELHDEALSLAGDPHNFTSLLRCACLTYVAEARGNPNADALLTPKKTKAASSELASAD